MALWLPSSYLRPIIRPSQTRTRSYRNRYIDTASLTTYSFAGCDIGATPPSGNREVVVVALADGGNARALVSATIAGNAATVHSTTNSTRTAAILSRTENAGTTATIAVAFNAGVFGCSIYVYALYGLSSGTPFDAGSGASGVDTLALPNDSILIFGKNNGTQGVTWSVTGPLGIDISGDYDASNGACASAEIPYNQFAVPIDLTPSSSTSPRRAWGIWR
ncbi:MAG: hypothetical protein JNJ53_10840 [Rhizobiales bacterium]|nr:hypothetical protein [Hyphomicrobiales bacterium]